MERLGKHKVPTADVPANTDATTIFIFRFLEVVMRSRKPRQFSHPTKERPIGIARVGQISDIATADKLEAFFNCPALAKK
jgi:hypothetical protein